MSHQTDALVITRYIKGGAGWQLASQLIGRFSPVSNIEIVRQQVDAAAQAVMDTLSALTGWDQERESLTKRIEDAVLGVL